MTTVRRPLAAGKAIAPSAPVFTFPRLSYVAGWLAIAQATLAFLAVPGTPRGSRDSAISSADLALSGVVAELTPHRKHPRCAAMLTEARRLQDKITEAALRLQCEAAVPVVVELPRPIVPWRPKRAANGNAATT